MSLSSPARFVAARFAPGKDLLEGIDEVLREHGLQAAFVATCVGSLTRCNIRFANKPTGTELTGHFEIVSLVGCMSLASGAHVHITLSDGEGRCWGGHLLPGSAVYTTAELVIGELSEAKFMREPCPASGYDELVVKCRSSTE